MTTISREELLRVAQLVRPALSTQSFIPALTHIHFNDGCADAYNDVTAVSVVMPKMEGGDLDLCLPGDLLIKTLNSFNTSEVLFKRGKDQSITLSSGRSNIKLHTLPSKDFPLRWPSGKPLAELDLTDDILKGLERCLMSVGADATHPAQLGVTLASNDAGHAVLYSTDNFTISRYVTKNQVKLPGGAPVILPTFFCEQVLALAKSFPDDEVLLLVHDGAVLAEIGHKASVLTKVLVDADPLDFESMISRYLKNSSIQKLHTPVPSELSQALGRALLVMGSSHDKFTEMHCTKEQLKLHSKSELGVSEDSMKIDADDAEQFVVDPSMVLRSLKTCTHLTMLRNVLVMSNADGSFIHLISHCAS